MTSKSTLHNPIKAALSALGELFIMGFNGLELSRDTSQFLSETKIGGVILFAHNFEIPGQLAELTNQIQEYRNDLPLWIAVDQEGGKVQRFKKGFTQFPTAASIGNTQSAKLAFDIAEALANELHAVGVNLNFCPVGDIATNPKNPVIGSRSFGNSEELVSKMASAFVRGHLVGRVQPCIKHFPGHGDTSQDSHFALPRVDTAVESLHNRELQPFIKAFKSKCPLVMTAHIIVSQLDPSVPATLSKIILQDLLRTQLRYDKIIVSDDMEMKAITDHFGAEEAPRMAIEAGCDLLIYRSEGAAKTAYQALSKALQDGKLSPQRVLESAKRSQDLKSKVLLPYHPASVPDLAKRLKIQKHQELVKALVE